MTSVISTFNYLTRNTVTVLAPISGGAINPNFPTENSTDSLTWSKTRLLTFNNNLDLVYDFGSAVNVECVGMAGHNVDGWIVRASDDGAVWDTIVALESFSRRGETAFRVLASAENRRYWRITTTTTAGSLLSEVGVAWLGPRYVAYDSPQASFTPPIFADQHRVQQNLGGGGSILGTSVVTAGKTLSWTIARVPWGTLEGEFRDHYDRINAGWPFMFSWDPTNRPMDVAYCIRNAPVAVGYDSHQRGQYTITANAV